VAILLSRSGPLGLLFVSKFKEVIKGTCFQDSEAIETAVDERAPSDLGRILPGVRGSTAEEIGKVHLSPRRLHCRQHVVKFTRQIQ